MRRVLWTAVAAMVLTGTASAGAAGGGVQSCTYRNVPTGTVPVVARVTTNLTPAAVGGGDVCAAVSAAARQVQLRGYHPGAGPALLGAGGRWRVSDRLVYPRGWPRPVGPVYDPHMQVTLRLLAQPTYWIRLRELT